MITSVPLHSEELLPLGFKLSPAEVYALTRFTISTTHHKYHYYIVVNLMRVFQVKRIMAQKYA